MEVSMIVAVSDNGVIGGNNKLLWNLKSDMKFFKETTNGSDVIMGRKTYDSIGRPLPNRTNIVVSKTVTELDKCIVADSIEAALKKTYKNNKVFIIGGGSIYEHSIKYVDTVYLTRVHTNIDNGDTFFNSELLDGFELVGRPTIVEKSEKDEFPFTIYKLVRKIK